jgi:hypothetical protein
MDVFFCDTRRRWAAGIFFYFALEPEGPTSESLRKHGTVLAVRRCSGFMRVRFGEDEDGVGLRPHCCTT